MGDLIPGVTTPPTLTLAAASSAADATLDLIEIGRESTIADAGDLASEFYGRETAEKLADALQSVLSIQLEAGAAEPQLRPREEAGQLLAALGRYLEAWA